MRRIFFLLFLFFFAAAASADSLSFKQLERGACSGDNLFLQFTLRNDGDSLKHYSLYLRGLDGKSFTEFSPSHVSVPARSSVDFELWATAAIDGIPADYVLVLSAVDAYGNMLSSQAVVSLDSCEYADAQIIPSRPTACIGGVTPISLEIRNAGKKPVAVLLNASLPLQFTLDRDRFALAAGDDARATLFVDVPKNFSPQALPFSVRVSTAGGRSREINSLIYADYCPNIRLYAPEKVSLRAEEKLDLLVTIENYGGKDDVVVLSLDCAPFASLSPTEFSLSGGASASSVLHLAPLYSDGGKTFSCKVVARSQRYSLSYSAQTNITVRRVPGKEVGESVVVQPNDFVQPAADAEIIIDSSESMADFVGGMRKMDVAKDFADYFLEHVSSMRVGLRTYGSQYSTNDLRACSDSVQLSPIKQDNVAAVKAMVASLQPRGMTPLAFALREAVNDFERRNDNLIVLVSDGVESCGQDPCLLAGELRGKGIRVYAIGFNINEAGRNQLKCVAEQTGGRYYDAGDYSELLGVIDQIFVRKQVADNLSIEVGEPVIVSQDEESASVKLNVSVFNYGDFTSAQASLEGLPEEANYSFDPASFSLARNQNASLALAVVIPRKQEAYNATIVVSSSHGVFSKQVVLFSRQPFSLTGLFAAAAPALAVFGALMIAALAALALFARKRLSEGGARELSSRLNRIKELIGSSPQRPLPVDSSSAEDEELALFLSSASR
ncbi:MAG: VWA domain-containing protein [Candidatus Micrarchaeia archaeon]